MPEIDPDGEHLWQWFWEIGSGRQVGMSNYQPLAWTDMQAWAALTGTEVRAEEWSVLRDMDRTFIDVAGKKAGGSSDEAERRANAQPINAQAFDAVFS